MLNGLCTNTTVKSLDLKVSLKRINSVLWRRRKKHRLNEKENWTVLVQDCSTRCILL